MIIYNITVKVHPAIHEQWLQWFKEAHVPEILATACFTNATIARLLETDDTEGPTYTAQLFAESKSLYNNYIENHAAVHRQKSYMKWGDQFIAFRSVMQVVN